MVTVIWKGWMMLLQHSGRIVFHVLVIAEQITTKDLQLNLKQITDTPSAGWQGSLQSQKCPRASRCRNYFWRSQDFLRFNAHFIGSRAVN